MHVRSLAAVVAAILVLTCGVALARDLTLVGRPPLLDPIKEVFVHPFVGATPVAAAAADAAEPASA